MPRNEVRGEGYFLTTVNKFSIHKVFRCSLVPQCMYMVCTQNPHLWSDELVAMAMAIYQYSKQVT